MNYHIFNRFERVLSAIAGTINLLVGIGFFFLPELQFPLWPSSIPAILTRFIGAIIIGNGVGALWLAREHEWARVRPLAIVATVYGTLVALALFYHLFWLHAPAIFGLYFFVDTPFLIAFYALFLYHDILPMSRKKSLAR